MWHVVCMVRISNAYMVLVRALQRRRMWCVDWRQGSCEHDNKPPDFIVAWNSLTCWGTIGFIRGTPLHRRGKFTLHSAHCSSTVMEPMEVIKQEYISLSFYDDTIVQHLSLTIHFKRNSTNKKELYLLHEICHINHKLFRSWSCLCHQEKYETYFWVYPWAGIRQSEWTQQSRFHNYTWRLKQKSCIS